MHDGRRFIPSTGPNNDNNNNDNNNNDSSVSENWWWKDWTWNYINAPIDQLAGVGVLSNTNTRDRSNFNIEDLKP